MEKIYESATETAKKVRKELKKTFPNTKFSVRSKTYSGGSSINVSWDDMPLTSEVETVLNKFESSSFDGMQDLQTTHGYIYEGVCYIGADYILSSRNLSDEYKQTLTEFANDFFGDMHKNSYDEYNHTDLLKAEKYYLESQQNETSKPTQATQQELNNQIVSNETTNNTNNTESTNAPIQAEMILNDSLNGVELTFSDKPNETVRKELKSNGFRYHAKKKIWYAKQSEKTINFAESIVSIYKDIEHDLTIQTEATATTPESTQTTNDTTTDQTTYNNNPITIETEQPQTLPNGKTAVKSITFIWSESAYIAVDTTVSTFQEAESLIKNAAIHAPDNGTYDKTRFLIRWNDDNTYSGRIDIVNSDLFKDTPLKDHVLYFAKSVINDNEGWHTEEEKQSYQHFLDTYSLEDYTQPEAITATTKQPAKVLDFNSKFQAKQKQQETEKAMDYFINDILPYISLDDKIKLQDAGEDKESFNSLIYDMMIKAKYNRLKQQNKS